MAGRTLALGSTKGCVPYFISILFNLKTFLFSSFSMGKYSHYPRTLPWLGAIQVLRNADCNGGGSVYGSAQISIMKGHAPMLLVLRGGGGMSHFPQKMLRNT